MCGKVGGWSGEGWVEGINSASHSQPKLSATSKLTGAISTTASASDSSEKAATASHPRHQTYHPPTHLREVKIDTLRVSRGSGPEKMCRHVCACVYGKDSGGGRGGGQDDGDSGLKPYLFMHSARLALVPNLCSKLRVAT